MSANVLYMFQGLSSIVGSIGSFQAASQQLEGGKQVAAGLRESGAKAMGQKLQEGQLHEKAIMGLYASRGVSATRPGDSPDRVLAVQRDRAWQNALNAAQDYENYAQYYLSQSQAKADAYTMQGYQSIASAAYSFFQAIPAGGPPEETKAPGTTPKPKDTRFDTRTVDEFYAAELGLGFPPQEAEL